jgi:hypothetical protein
MRTTLDIDDDLLRIAKEIAVAEKKTTGKVLSDLARKALTTPGFGEDVQPELDRGWYVLPRRGGGIVTNELVRRLLDEADFEDAGLRKPD